MKLIELQIRNFKGFTNFTFTPDGKNLTVYGDNATGKSTICDAVQWLYFGKDSLDQANFAIKPIGMVGTPIAPVECEVKAVFTNGISQGTTSLCRVMTEKWTKQRGSVLKELTGHTTEYYIDDTPVTEGAYKIKVGEITTGEQIFKLLTSCTYFNETMHWKERITLLLNICGTITDADVINAFPELSALPALLQGKDPEAFKATIMSQRKEINTKIEGIPARIDEVQRGRPENVDSGQKSAKADFLTSTRNLLAAKNTELTQAEMGGGVAATKAKIADVELQITQLKNTILQAKNKKVQDIQERLNNLKQEEPKLNLKTSTAKTNLGIATSDRQHTVEVTEKLRDEYAAIDALVFTGNHCPYCSQVLPADHCPYCSQVLPADQLEAAEKAFNLEKSTKLTKCVETGQANNQRISELDAEIKAYGVEIEATGKTITDLKKSIQEVTGELQKAKDDDGKTQELTALDFSMSNLHLELEKNKLGSRDLVEKLTAEKTRLEKSIEETEKVIAQIDQAEKDDARIAELKQEEKDLAAKFEVTERNLFLIETLIKKKCEMLEGVINSRFPTVRFRLFKNQINGGIEPICEAEVCGVPYNSLNHAKRIHAGLEIIDVVGDYYGFHPMVFVDGKESLTTMPEMKSQVICMVVSEPDKKLRFEAQ